MSSFIGKDKQKFIVAEGMVVVGDVDITRNRDNTRESGQGHSLEAKWPLATW